MMYKTTMQKRPIPVPVRWDCDVVWGGGLPQAKPIYVLGCHGQTDSTCAN